MKRFLLGLLISIFIFSTAIAEIVSVEGVLPLTALTVSGGATPSVTGPAIDLRNSAGQLSLILINGGASTSLTVTYQLGYITRANAPIQTITWITPDDGGAVADFTAVNIAAGSRHTNVSLDQAQYYRLIITNNDAANTATVSLYVLHELVSN